MKLSTCSAALFLSFMVVSSLSAQSAGEEKQEFGVTVGQLSGTSPGVAGGPLTLDSGVAVEANFARKVRELGFGNLYWEVDGLVGPIRYVTGTPTTATHSINSVFLTPGVKLQFTPKEPLSPWVAVGGGYGFYHSSNSSIAGGTAAGGTTNTYAVDFGGGMDWAMNKHYVIRADFRGFYTGAPNYGINVPGGQFNFVIGGGLVWRFSK